ncbi:MAG: hypothetical protein ACRDV9_03095 [Acidimicrobiia bacterium]
MGHRDLLKGWWGGAAMAALALVILAAGFCCLDQGQNGMDDHAMLMDLCFLVLVAPAVILLLAGLLPRGLAVNLGLPAFAAIAIAVPKPPPRSFRLA